MIYDAFVDNITGKIIDSTVDNAIDSIKERNILNTTYVWTAISKETHGGKIANLIFINKLGQRRRVQYEKLNDFCINNYVSNVIVNDGKVSMVGCLFSDLPDYRLNQNGQYDLHAKYSEQYIYNKALAYIQSEERKIYEDFQNKCMKGNREIEPTQSNITSNLSAIKDISTATAVTAVTAAGAATVAGVGVAAKTIYKKVNSKKLVEMQLELYKSLNKCSEMIGTLTKMKYNLNTYIRNHPNLLEYNNSLEAQHELSGKLKNEVLKYGVMGCIRVISNNIEQIRSKAEVNKILTDPLKLNNSNIGSLESYINSLNNKINIIKQEHNVTKQLINANNQRKYNEQQLAIEAERQRQLQIDLVQNVTQMINELENNINYFNTVELNDTSVEYNAEKFNSLGLDNTINNIDAYINNITDIENKNSLKNKLTYLKNEVIKIGDNLRVALINKNNTIKNNIIAKIEFIETRVNELLSENNCNATNINVIDEVNINISEVKTLLINMNDTEVEVFKQRLNEAENTLNKNRSIINLNIRRYNNDIQAETEINEYIQRVNDEISRETSSKGMKNTIDRFKQSTSYKLNSIKSIDIQNRCRQKVNDTTQQVNIKLDNKIEEENRENDRIKQIGEQLLADLRREISRVEEVDTNIVTQETLDNFVVDINSYEDRKREYDFGYSGLGRDINNTFSSLNTKYGIKRRAIESRLNELERSRANILNTIENIENKLDRMTKYDINSVLRNIKAINLDMNYKRLLDKDKAEINNKIEKLLDDYNKKVQTLV